MLGADPSEQFGRGSRRAPVGRKPDRRDKPNAAPKNDGEGRYFGDPSATFRHSNGSKQLEFGHLGLGGTTRVGSLDIPLFSAMAEPHQGETPQMMRAIVQFRQALARYDIALQLYAVVGDAGFDAHAFYCFANEHGLTAIVPTTEPRPLDTKIPRDAQGTPLCPGNAAMSYHSSQDGKLVYRCPAQRGRRINGKFVTQFVPSACPLNRTEPCTLPDSDPAPAGPWLRVPMDNDPRHNQPIPRQSTEFTRLLAQRTSTERHFAHQHQLLPDRTYRRKHLWQIGTALHTLMRMGAAIVAKHKARFDALWNELFPKQQAA